jgi:alpha-glucosidase (family GH31 glycosyl hydrolase)
MIYHYPSGTNPYKSCGYDRIPLYPSEGEIIFVRCIPPETDPKPTLFVRVNNHLEMHYGILDKTVANGCVCFQIGPYAALTEVEYAFSFDKESKYHFIVSQCTEFINCHTLLQGDNEVRAVCTMGNGKPLTLVLTPENHGFYIRIVQEWIPSNANAVDKAVLQTGEGYLLCLTRKPFSLVLKDLSKDVLLNFNQYHHTARFILDQNGAVRRFSVSCAVAGNGFYGCGEKFDRVNQRGLKPFNCVYEHYTQQGEHTYLPMPWLFSERGWGLLIETGCISRFGLTQSLNGVFELNFEAETGSEGFAPMHLFCGPPSLLLNELHRVTGSAELPPKWAFGPWMSANGWNTQDEVLQQIRKSKELDIPATVLVLEAWSDETTFYIWNGAKYTPRANGVFQYSDFMFLPNGPWPDPKAFSQFLEQEGLHLILWQIPVIKKADDNQCQQLFLDEREAIECNYCVKNMDGSPYRIPLDRWFGGSLLIDFSNPNAVDWWLSKRRYLRDELHVEGFKTDGGEFVYDPTVQFANGKTGLEMRNLYPAYYTQEYYNFLQEGDRPGVIFSRAGYIGSQRRPMHWAGDQLSTFEELRGQLVAGLSAGLSGILFWGFDIAGFAGELPTTELYLRAVALATFCPVMQFHSEPRSGQYGNSRRRDWINDRSPWNLARVNDASEIINVYRYYAKLRMKLLPYIYEEAQYSVKNARPLLCHLIYDYPEDPQVIDLEDEYMFGRTLLVAPVLTEGSSGREVYLPEGEWFNFWTGIRHTGGGHVFVECPIGEIPVFSRDATFLAKFLRD